MKIKLQLTSSCWAQLKVELLRLNYQLANQGLTHARLVELLEYLDQDEQLFYSPLKLAVILQAMLSKAATNLGCTLGLAFLKSLTAQGWVVITDAEREALQNFDEPMPLAEWQHELLESFSLGRDQSFEYIMGQILWQNPQGQWFIDALALLALYERASSSIQAAFNHLLLEILVAQQVRADWIADAITKLEDYAQSTQQKVVEGKSCAALAAYHLCELYRLVLHDKSLALEERQAIEEKWRVAYQQLQNNKHAFKLQTQAESRFIRKPRSLLFYFYQQAHAETKPSDEAALAIEPDVKANSPYDIYATDTDSGSWWLVGGYVLYCVVSTVLLWLVFKAAFVSTPSLAVFAGLLLLVYIAFYLLAVGVYELSNCFSDALPVREAPVAASLPTVVISAQEKLYPLEVELPVSTQNLAASSTCASTAQATSARAMSMGQYLNRFGLYKTKPVETADKTTAEQANNLIA